MLLLLVSTTVIEAQTIDTAVADLKRLVNEGDYEAAASLAVRTEGSNADAAQSFEFQFMRGVALQQIASGGNVPAERRAKAIAEANAAYGRAAQLRPQSVATLNNLAVLNAAAGLDERARDEYERAVKLAAENADPKLEAYALNYANYLENRDGDAAIRQAVIAMKAPHSGAESRGLLASLYARYQPEALLPFARTLYDEGRTAQVRQLALAQSGNVKLPTAARVNWLSLLALSLSRDALAQKAFDVDSVVGPLKSMAADDVRTVAMQLALVLTDPPPDSDGLGRWRYRAQYQRRSRPRLVQPCANCCRRLANGTSGWRLQAVSCRRNTIGSLSNSVSAARIRRHSLI